MAPESKKKNNVEFDVGRELFDWAGAMVNAIVTVVLIFAFVCGVFRVDGPSMLPTLHNGEFMLVSRLFYTPKAGDIVVFSKMDGHFIDEKTGRESPLVKRVVGVGGDTLRIDYNENAIYVKSEGDSDFHKLNQDYLPSDLVMNPKAYESGYISPLVQEVIISPGCVFVCGDNRNNSLDSRDLNTIGEVDQRYILGRVLLRLTPLSRFGPVS